MNELAVLRWKGPRLLAVLTYGPRGLTSWRMQFLGLGAIHSDLEAEKERLLARYA